MTSSFTFNFMDLNFPEPKWKNQVERWYQIDPPSFALCESYYQNQDFLKSPPDLVLLGSPQASFKTDQNFTKTLSPSKFVHTLPNVRTSALFQLTQWRGPMISFVGDRAQLMNEAQMFLETKKYNRIWAIYIQENPHLLVEWHVLDLTGNPA